MALDVRTLMMLPEFVKMQKGGLAFAEPPFYTELFGFYYLTSASEL